MHYDSVERAWSVNGGGRPYIYIYIYIYIWVLAVPCYGHLCYAGNVRAQALSVTDSGPPGALSVTAFWNIRDPVRYRFGNRRRCNGAVAEGVTGL